MGDLGATPEQWIWLYYARPACRGRRLSQPVTSFRLNNVKRDEIKTSIQSSTQTMTCLGIMKTNLVAI